MNKIIKVMASSFFLIHCSMIQGMQGPHFEETRRTPNVNELPSEAECNAFRQEYAGILQGADLSREQLRNIVWVVQNLEQPDKETCKSFKKEYATTTFQLDLEKKAIPINDRRNVGLKGIKTSTSIDKFPFMAVAPHDIASEIQGFINTATTEGVSNLNQDDDKKYIKKEFTRFGNNEATIIALTGNQKWGKSLGVDWLQMDSDTRDMYKNSNEKVENVSKYLSKKYGSMDGIGDIDWVNLEDITVKVSARKPTGALTAHVVVNAERKPFTNGIDKQIIRDLHKNFGIKTTGIVVKNTTKAINKKMRHLIANQEALAQLNFENDQINQVNEFQNPLFKDFYQKKLMVAPVDRRQLVKDVHNKGAALYCANSNKVSLDACTLSEQNKLDSVVINLRDSNDPYPLLVNYNHDQKKDMIHENIKDVKTALNKAILERNKKQALYETIQK